MKELGGAVLLGTAYGIGLAWLPFAVDPCLLVVLLIAVVTTHEWAGLALTLGMGVCAEAMLLTPPGVYLTAYIMAFTVIRAVAHRMRLESVGMRLMTISGGAILATLVLTQLYIQPAVHWLDLMTITDGASLALTILTATLLVPVLSAWRDGRWRRRPRGLC